MKIRYVIRLHCPYFIVLINSILLAFAYYQFIFIIVLLYTYLFNQLNKKGFITVSMYSVVIGINALMFIASNHNLVNFMTSVGSILCAILFLHTFLPIRLKVKSVLKQININKKLIIYHNRIEQENSIISLKSDFRQSEIRWLCYKILSKSHTLSRIEETSIDNEIFGQHIQMNIV